jgi:hypothetical protein
MTIRSSNSMTVGAGQTNPPMWETRLAQPHYPRPTTRFGSNQWLNFALMYAGTELN